MWASYRESGSAAWQNGRVQPKADRYAYIRREALVSSQIEGTQSSLSDLLLFELNEAPGVPFDDVVEVSNYIAALNHGLERLRGGFPLSNRLLREPLLYLSLYFKQNRATYYQLLDAVRYDGDWEAWLDFFLEGVQVTATGAVETANRLVTLFQEDADRIQNLGRAAANTLRVFDAFRSRPVASIKDIQHRLGLAAPTVGRAVDALEEMGVVEEITGRQRDRVYAYRRYLDILNEGAEPL